jgi:hypothetical protein
MSGDEEGNEEEYSEPAEEAAREELRAATMDELRQHNFDLMLNQLARVHHSGPKIYAELGIDSSKFEGKTQAQIEEYITQCCSGSAKLAKLKTLIAAAEGEIVEDTAVDLASGIIPRGEYTQDEMATIYCPGEKKLEKLFKQTVRLGEMVDRLTCDIALLEEDSESGKLLQQFLETKRDLNSATKEYNAECKKLIAGKIIPNAYKMQAVERSHGEPKLYEIQGFSVCFRETCDYAHMVGTASAYSPMSNYLDFASKDECTTRVGDVVDYEYPESKQHSDGTITWRNKVERVVVKAVKVVQLPLYELVSIDPKQKKVVYRSTVLPDVTQFVAWKPKAARAAKAGSAKAAPPPQGEEGCGGFGV